MQGLRLVSPSVPVTGTPGHCHLCFLWAWPLHVSEHLVPHPKMEGSDQTRDQLTFPVKGQELVF